jgi:hypothetical protein
MIGLHEIPPEDFEALVGQTVTLAATDRRFECLLAEVVRSPYPTGRQGSGFSVTLHGPATQPLGQGIYALQHPTHGELNLFLTPIGRDTDSIRYEIVFN